jgi:hypothetical protein
VTGLTDEIQRAWDFLAQLLNSLLPDAASDSFRVRDLFDSL